MECKVCGHKHNIWDTDEMELKYTETEEFIRIEGTFEKVIDLEWRKTTFYACPKCGVLQIEI